MNCPLTVGVISQSPVHR